MAVKISNAVAILACNAINGALDANGPGTLTIYNGTRPADLDEAIVAQTELATFTLPNPCFPSAVDDENGYARATANPIAPVDVEATVPEEGLVAQFYRAFDGAGTPIMDGSVTDQNGNGDCKLSDTTLLPGIQVQVFSFQSFMPEGA